MNYKYASKLRSRRLFGRELGDPVVRFTPNENQACLPNGDRPELTLANLARYSLLPREDRKQLYFILVEHHIVNPFLHRRMTLPPLEPAWRMEDLTWFVDKIRSFKPAVLALNPHYAYFLAKYLESRQERFDFDHIVDLTGALSTKGHRDFVSERFGGPVYQIYGSSEFGRITTQCTHSDGPMHILEDIYHVEFIREDGTQAVEGEPASIVVTALTNYAMPFIRYRIGDVGWYTDRECRCGRRTRMMDVKGRLANAVITGDGRIIHEEFFVEKLLGLPGIFLFQFLQRKKDTFELKVVREGAKPLARKKVRETLLGELGAGAKLTIREVDAIPPEPSGKYSLVKSDCQGG